MRFGVGLYKMKRIFQIIILLIVLIPQLGVKASFETAESICLLNSITGEVVYEKNFKEKKSMASTTKIMTLITALENSKLDDTVTVCKEAPLAEGSSAYIKADAKISMRDLLYGLMLNSGNDAAIAVACHISGDTKHFADLMNDTAKKIGVRNSHFKNPNGLEEEGHYTTAYDLAKITQYAMKNPDFVAIVSSKSHTAQMMLTDGTIENIEYYNHNRLLKELDGCIGVKTGFTKAAGRCLVSATKRDGAEYIAVTLNDSDDWNTHKQLHSMAYNSQTYKTVVKQGDCIKHVIADRNECKFVAKEEYGIYVNSDSKHNIEIITHIPKKINFAINKGEKVGYLEIKANDVTIGKVDVVSDDDFSLNKDTRVKNCFVFTLSTLLRNIL